MSGRRLLYLLVSCSYWDGELEVGSAELEDWLLSNKRQTHSWLDFISAAYDSFKELDRDSRDSRSARSLDG